MAEDKKNSKKEIFPKSNISEKERERTLRRYRNYYSNNAIIDRAARENLTEK